MINPDKLKLISPNLAFQRSYSDYINELGDEERYPFPMDFDHHDFPAMLQKIANFAAGVNLPVGYVPSTTLWLVSQSELLGVVNIRHFLNESLKTAGGHIGLGIRPSMRGQSLGNYLLAQGIDTAGKLGIETIHIHCYKSNLASAGMIRRNGGILHSEIQTGSDVVQRYRVTYAGTC